MDSTVPAYNAEEWIAETIESAIGQTWQRKEIIVVDDGSTDGTLGVARRFERENIRVVSTENRGAVAARNYLLSVAQGDYIQWLDHDDILAPHKIERQLGALRESDGTTTLLSGPRGYFYYSTRRAWFPRTCLWQDLSPVEWLLRKMGENLPMQTSTWLTSRELAEAAGPWDTRMLSDDDGGVFLPCALGIKGDSFRARS